MAVLLAMGASAHTAIPHSHNLFGHESGPGKTQTPVGERGPSLDKLRAAPVAFVPEQSRTTRKRRRAAARPESSEPAAVVATLSSAPTSAPAPVEPPLPPQDGRTESVPAPRAQPNGATGARPFPPANPQPGREDPAERARRPGGQ